MFVHNVEARLNGADVYAHPNRFFIATRLAENCVAPKPSHSFPFDIWYGYHFDAVDEKIPSQTISTAMRHGWKWKIPLTSRYGNGYVYSSAFCTPDEAERELREDLGLLDSDTEARHLKMKIGRCTQHWNRNCLAVGLSQGFIEPLEATRDYIVTHYKTNSRTDTEYWRANAANMNLSDSLKQIYGMWTAGQSIAADVGRQAIGKGYPIFSWYCIMAGMGLFPAAKDLRPAAAGKAYDMAEIDNLLQRSALNFRDQREVLADIPKKRKESAMQIYFW